MRALYYLSMVTLVSLLLLISSSSASTAAIKKNLLSAILQDMSFIRCNWKTAIKGRSISNITVYRKVNEGKFEFVSKFSGNAKKFIDSNIEIDSSYTYRVVIKLKKGKRYRLTSKKVTVRNPKGSPSITLNASSKSSDEIDLDWKIIGKEAYSVQIERGLEAGKLQRINFVEGTSEYHDENLNSNTLYFYRLRLKSTSGKTYLSGTISQKTKSFNITIPIEVLSATQVQETVTIPAEILLKEKEGSTLLLTVHGLQYDNQGSVSFNDQYSIPLANSTIQLVDDHKQFGGIGGAFHTLTFSLPIPSNGLKIGKNQITFSFNGTDGHSIGFRILGFNVLNAEGQKLIPDTVFTREDPNNWTSPSADAAVIARGRSLWTGATLLESSLPNSSAMTATCSDCHALDGRDLKYFNFSSRSIIERTKFHGLSTEDGIAIASYIRSLPYKNPGRPWNPPYQPGPGLDSKPREEWSAGAGIEAVLKSDLEMFPYLFPEGISKSALNAQESLNVREIPIRYQFPDWNHWLPRIHPKDAYKEVFLNSEFAAMYNDGSRAFNSSIAINDYLSTLQKPYAQWPLFEISTRFYRWLQKRDLVFSQVMPPYQDVTIEDSNKIYAMALWQMVKTWELTQLYELDAKENIQTLYGAEEPGWSHPVPFNASPHKLSIPISDTQGINGNALLTQYLDYIWYDIQMVLGYGFKKHADALGPIDWNYQITHGYGFSNKFSPGALFMTRISTKGLQATANGLGPEVNLYGFYPHNAANIYYLLGDSRLDMWKGYDPEFRKEIAGALMEAWLDQLKHFSPSQYYVRWADPSETPVKYDPGGRWIDRVKVTLDAFGHIGVDYSILKSVTDWASTLWPATGWEAYLPKFTLFSPTYNQTMKAGTMEVKYIVTAQIPNADRVYIWLDEDPKQVDFDLDGKIVLTGVKPGRHYLKGYVADNANQMIPDTAAFILFDASQ